jgi:hypothetical protein
MGKIPLVGDRDLNQRVTRLKTDPRRQVPYEERACPRWRNVSSKGNDEFTKDQDCASQAVEEGRGARRRSLGAEVRDPSEHGTSSQALG